MPSRKPLTRSEQMARIRGRDTRPEMVLRRALWQAGLRYRVQMRVLRLAPDLVFPSRAVVVFLDGCFWHGCPEHYVFPRSRRDFWLAKLEANVARDIRQTEALREAGWTVLRFWEHEVFEALEAVVDGIRAVVRPSRVPAALPGSSPLPPRWAVHHVEEVDASTRLERWRLVDVSSPANTREELLHHRTGKWKRAVPPEGGAGQSRTCAQGA